MPVTTNLAWSSASTGNSTAYIPDSTAGPKIAPPLSSTVAYPLETSGSFAMHPVTLQQPVAQGMPKKKFLGLSECPELPRLMKDLGSARRRAYGLTTIPGELRMVAWSRPPMMGSKTVPHRSRLIDGSLSFDRFRVGCMAATVALGQLRK